MEQWAKVKGFEGYTGADKLEVSSLGNARCTDGSDVIWMEDPFGRRFIQFVTSGHRESVARLVLLTFIGPPPLNMFAVYKNKVLNDNQLDNLEWGNTTRKVGRVVEKKVRAKKRKRPDTGRRVFDAWIDKYR